MGRASRRKQAPADLNRGDIGRMVLAHGACVILLATDLRVQEFYKSWSAEHERLLAAGPPPGLSSVAELDQLIARQRESEIDALMEVLRPMNVPWRWAAEALVTNVFPIARYNARCAPTDRKMLGISASGVVGFPMGRKPRHQGKDVRQWVDWWYRHTVKHPSDSVYALAKEYAEREKRHTRADSVVVDGIQRAEHLLNRVYVRPGGAPSL